MARKIAFYDVGSSVAFSEYGRESTDPEIQILEEDYCAYIKSYRDKTLLAKKQRDRVRNKNLELFSEFEQAEKQYRKLKGQINRKLKADKTYSDHSLVIENMQNILRNAVNDPHTGKKQFAFVPGKDGGIVYKHTFKPRFFVCRESK